MHGDGHFRGGPRAICHYNAATLQGENAMIKVYGRANSINVRRVLWMLEELGLKYEREDWGRQADRQPGVPQDQSDRRGAGHRR